MSVDRAEQLRRTKRWWRSFRAALTGFSASTPTLDIIDAAFGSEHMMFEEKSAAADIVRRAKMVADLSVGIEIGPNTLISVDRAGSISISQERK